MWTEQKKAQWAEKKRQLMERVRTARGTVQFQLTAVYCAIVLLLLLILNIYPVISTRNVVFRDKERSMTASASVISSALTGLDTLTGENVAPVLEILDVADYHEAVSIADARSQPGDVVILSPASTSFDRFANFMERGQVFKAIVNELK